MFIFKIEEVANMVGLTKRTLRYYEELGLIPAPHRTEGGFRMYTDHHVDRLKKLITARDVLGFTLQDLQQYVSIVEDFSNHRDALKQIDDLEERLKKMEELDQLVTNQIEMLDQKLEKMRKVRSELDQLQVKITDAKQRTKDQISNQE